ISENEKTSQLLRYFGEDYLIGISTCDDLVTENNEGLTAILEDALSKHQDILFMAIDVEESTEFTNSQAWYVLHLYGPLINGQKAVVLITGIQVFFDILVPED
ncbi:11663_t:CDS:1, partial [Cetraspora pellucida]